MKTLARAAAHAFLLLVVSLFAPAAPAQSLDAHWDPGAADCTPAEARTETYAIDAETIVIRQNPCVDYEAPLLYLLIGEQRALLIDSGASEAPRDTAELTSRVGAYLQRPDGSRLPLVVAHTHRHQDHRAGDAAFAALPATTVVPYEGAGMRKFFGLENWPGGSARFDLGGRLVEIIPTPGHQADHVVFVDTRTRLLFSGDFVLPGRLLVEDIDAYVESALRVLEAVNNYNIRYALGAHIEMDSHGELYPSGSTLHVDEHGMALEFATEQATTLRQDLMDFNGFYDQHAAWTIENPIRNLMVLAAGILLVLAFLVWGGRRLWKRRRAAVS